MSKNKQVDLQEQLLADAIGNFKGVPTVIKDKLSQIHAIISAHGSDNDVWLPYVKDELCFLDIINIVSIVNQSVVVMGDDFFDLAYEESIVKNEISYAWLEIYFLMEDVISWASKAFDFRIVKFGDEWFIFYQDSWIEISMDFDQ